MIDNRDNLNRPRVGNAGFGWGLPLGIAALAIVLGIYFLSPRGTTTTASNTSPATTSTSAPNAQSTPSANVGKAAPPPTTAPKQ